MKNSHHRRSPKSKMLKTDPDINQHPKQGQDNGLNSLGTQRLADHRPHLFYTQNLKSIVRHLTFKNSQPPGHRVSCWVRMMTFSGALGKVWITAFSTLPSLSRPRNPSAVIGLVKFKLLDLPSGKINTKSSIFFMHKINSPGNDDGCRKEQNKYISCLKS